jgi:hypothetical protein
MRALHAYRCLPLQVVEAQRSMAVLLLTHFVYCAGFVCLWKVTRPRAAGSSLWGHGGHATCNLSCARRELFSSAHGA